MSFSVNPIELSSDPTDFQTLITPHCASLGLSHPARLSIIGSSGSGKSVLISNLLCRPEFFYGFFSRVVIISPNFLTDRAYAVVEDYLSKLEKEYRFELIAFEKYDPAECNALLQEVIEDLAKSKEKYKKSTAKNRELKIPRTLFLLDDVVDDKALLKSEFLSILSTRGRHLNASVWISTQKYKALPTVWRLNATNTIFFQPSNQSEAENIYDELMKGYTKQEFFDLLEYAFEKPHQFLMLNAGKPMNKFVMKNFDGYLIKG